MEVTSISEWHKNKHNLSRTKERVGAGGRGGGVEWVEKGANTKVVGGVGGGNH